MSQPTPPPFTAPLKKPPHTDTGQPLPPTDDSSQNPTNPFLVALEGVKSLFVFAKPVAMVLLVLSIIFGLANLATSTYDMMNPQEPSTWNTSTDTTASPTSIAEFNNMTLPGVDFDLTPESFGAIVIIAGFVIFVVTVLLLVIGAIFTGLGDIAAAASVNKKTITLKQALSTLLARFPAYLWLIVLVAVKTFLWSLLFIIPGIIMSIRYSLAGTAFFARNMKASEAIKYSTKITKGGWITLFASQTLPNIVTLGLIQLLVQPGVYAELFRQYDHYDTNGVAKPKAHIISIIYFVILASIVAIAIAALLLIVPLAVLSNI